MSGTGPRGAFAGSNSIDQQTLIPVDQRIQKKPAARPQPNDVMPLTVTFGSGYQLVSNFL